MTQSLLAIDQLSALGSIEAYTHWVNQTPMLSAEEELEFATRWYEDQDVEAARQLTLSHLRFVAKVARGYLGYGLSHADLIQEGNIGLMKAIKRFNPTVGVRLVSFAVHWIKAEMHEFILKNWRIVKMATTKAQRKLFFNLRSQKKRLGWFTQEEVKDVAETLGVTTKDVLQMESRLAHYDTAFDAPAGANDDEVATAPSQYLEDHSADPLLQLENQDRAAMGQQALHHALSQLDDRARDIVERRWLTDEKKPTLHELAAEYNVSAERIRQLEKQAMKQLKALLH